MKIEIVKILAPAIFTLIGIFIGNHLSYKNSIKIHNEQKRTENQKKSYSKLRSLKNPWTQNINLNLEAKLLCEFYEKRFLLLTHDKEDLIEAKRQNERGIESIKEISNYQMQMFENLALIELSFKIDKELQEAIDDIYNYRALGIKKFPKNLKTQKELDELLEKQFKNVEKAIDSEYREKINRLINILKHKLKE
ncbi:hypothetical protein [Tenacibaculum finnmarkense]|uniref:hypothetical protein n=1 Tax=Tenacibaculum finnmarkense TaxID=2781243 RepID=UPI003BB72CAA